MPGAYAHLSIANDAQKRARTAGLRMETLASLGLYLKYVELGAVSPDYPYLSLARGQKKWADAMHYTRTATLLRAGVAAVATLNGPDRQRATAWLFGFAAHMAADMTIHPVIEMQIGPYKGNESAHRRCEMHQDAYIFPRVMDVGETGLSEHLASGIATCHAHGDKDAFDPIIERVWLVMLKSAYPDMSTNEPPRPATWHRGFRTILSTMASANHLFPFARHVTVGMHLNYPRPQDIDHSVIRQLRTPEGAMDYDAIYERARTNVLGLWKVIDAALPSGRSKTLDLCEDWNLDTGRTVPAGRLVFWREAA